MLAAFADLVVVWLNLKFQTGWLDKKQLGHAEVLVDE
jgi:hypothetical protein